MNFRVLENQSQSWKSPGNFFLEKSKNPVWNKTIFNLPLLYFILEVEKHVKRQQELF